MKTKFFLLLTLVSFSTIWAQGFDKLLYSKKDKPTVLINKNIIANSEVMQTIPGDKMVRVEVLKSAKKNLDQYAQI
ncbi:hypothetical protein, partial [Kaistella sp.]|uniref:hypothetical protein n=1 Tax=Kaistella sp. TaxID=2782235 RepID=UPI003C49BB76